MTKSEIEDFDDPEIQQWVENYDVKIDPEQYVKFTQKMKEDIAKQILLSTCKKVAALEGLAAANDLLKFHLHTPIELDPKDLLKEIESMADFEMKVLAIQTSNLSEDTKEKILQQLISNFGKPEVSIPVKKEKNPIIEMLRKEINKINSELSEQASRDINRVERRNTERKKNK